MLANTVGTFSALWVWLEWISFGGFELSNSSIYQTTKWPIRAGPGNKVPALLTPKKQLVFKVNLKWHSFCLAWDRKLKLFLYSYVKQENIIYRYTVRVSSHTPHSNTYSFFLFLTSVTQHSTHIWHWYASRRSKVQLHLALLWIVGGDCLDIQSDRWWCSGQHSLGGEVLVLLAGPGAWTGTYSVFAYIHSSDREV